MRTAAIGLSLLACACSGAVSNAVPSPSPSSSGQLSIEVTDAPFDHTAVRRAVVGISEIRMHADGDASSDFITLREGQSIPLDLMELRNGLTELLLLADVPAGDYRQLRVQVDDALLELRNGNQYSTADGTLKLSSQDTSGFKLFIDPPIRVRGGELTRVLLDFDLPKTFKAVPPKDPLNANFFQLHPVIHVSNLDEVGEIRGVVTRDDGSGTQVPAEDAVVRVLPRGELDLDLSLMSTSTEPDGSFAVLGIDEGLYDVVAVSDGAEDRTDAVFVSSGGLAAVDLHVE